MKVLQSEKLKLSVAQYLRYQYQCTIVATEYSNRFGIADVFAVRKNKKTIEIEIKCTKNDLLSEINAINEHKSTGFGNEIPRNVHKMFKHRIYLSENPLQNLDKVSVVPNAFYFGVPQELAEYAQEKLKSYDIPYGLIVIHFGLWNGCYMLKKAKDLHKQVIEEWDLASICRRVTTENFYLREKNIALKESINT